MTGRADNSSSRLELSFMLAVGSLIFFSGLFPLLPAGISAAIPQWAFLLLITLPIQAGNIASCVIPARYFCPDKPLRSTLDLKIPESHDFPMIIPGTIAIYFGLALITGIAIFMLRKAGIQPQEQLAVTMIRNGPPLLLWILIPVTVLLAPVGEELCFRHAIYKKLEADLGPVHSSWLTALLFAAAHLNLQVFPALFLLSLWLTALYRKTGSLLAPMISHALFNIMTILLLFLTTPS